MQHFYGPHSFLLFDGDTDDLFPYRFVTRLGFSLPRPAETAPGRPILTSLSVSLPGPVLSLFCLQAEQGLSLPVNALSLLGQQVIATSVSAVSPPVSLSSMQGCPGVSQLFSRLVILYSKALRKSFVLFFKLFRRV